MSVLVRTMDLLVCSTHKLDDLQGHVDKAKNAERSLELVNIQASNLFIIL